MVLDRRMFRRPSQMAPQRGPSSRGVGITSGLTSKPVQKFEPGGLASTIRVTRGELEPILQEYFPKEDFFDRAGTSPLKFFAALGSPMAPGQTVLGKIGEAGQFLDIKPESDRAGDLATELAIQTGIKSLDKDDSPQFDYEIAADRVIKVNKRTGESNIEYDFSNEDTDKFDHIISGGVVLKVDKETGDSTIAHDLRPDPEVKRENFDNYTIQLGNGMEQRMMSYLENGEVVNKKIGDPYMIVTDPETPFEFEKKLSSLADLMREQKGPDGEALYTEDDIIRAQIDLLNKQPNLTFDEELKLVEANLDAQGKAKWAEGQLTQLDVDLTQLNQKESNLTTRRNVLDAAITDPTLYDTRVALENFFTTFPSLKTNLGPIYDKINDFITKGQAIPTQTLQTLTNQSILDVAAGGAIPGNFNTKEFEAVIGAAGPAFLNRDAQEFIINLNLADVAIQKQVKQELDRLMAEGKKSTLEIVQEVNALKNKLYGDYRNSQEYADGVELLTNIGKAKKPDYFLTLGDVTIRGEKLNMTELYKANKVALAGYTDSNGLFVSRTGKQVIANPNQPIYAVIVGKKEDKSDGVVKDVVRYYAADQF